MNDESLPLIIGFDGLLMTPELRKRLCNINPMGVILFKRNIESFHQTQRLIQEIKSLLGNILITVDHEGGIVNRFPLDCPTPPSARALYHSGVLENVEIACRIQADLLKNLGFNMNFAPVLDIYNAQAGHVIGSRSFSADPIELGQYGVSCIRVHQKYGIACTGKHFPGHGNSLIDSHVDVGSVMLSEKELEQQDWIPFQMAIKEKVDAIMMAHLSFPKLDAKLPASLSEVIITQVLKKQLQYRGLVILDCVEMAGISKVYSTDQIVRYGIRAGVDLWISSFSLNKDPELQLKLKIELQQAQQNSSDIQQAFEATRQKIRDIVNTFHSIEPSSLEIDEMEANRNLHQVTLYKNKVPAILPTHNQYLLLELSNSKMECVNEGNPSTLFSDDKEEKLFLRKKLLGVHDIDLFQEQLLQANSEQLTVILITKNGVLLEGYEEFIQVLTLATSSIHIALESKLDFRGVSKNEWTPFGANDWTKKLLLEELKNFRNST